MTSKRIANCRLQICNFRRLFFLFIVLSFANIALAQDPVGKLELKKLSNSVYIFTTYNKLGKDTFPSNGLLIGTKKGVVIIDSPWDTTQCWPLLDSIQRIFNSKPFVAIATHFHDDRTGAFNFFKQQGILTYSTKLTYELGEKNKELLAERVFKSDTIFVFGDKKIECYYPGAGHTQDNIVVWLPQEKILYGGCLVKSLENQSIGNIKDADLEEWPKSVNKVIKKYKDVKIVIPGHYSYSDKEALYHTIKLIKKQ